eukprot:2057469-Pleurochrysis_carterae.AAC.2
MDSSLEHGQPSAPRENLRCTSHTAGLNAFRRTVCDFAETRIKGQEHGDVGLHASHWEAVGIYSSVEANNW